MKNILASIIALTLFPLAACSHETAGNPPPSFGSAVSQNIAAQIVNPDAPESNEPPVYEGNRAILAQKRYVTDKAETPVATTTSSVQGSGGGE